jgi:pSer/pThr/pTyr-binding forkhead associated (FHA) protein
VFTPVTWTATVAPDRVYYDRMRVTMSLSDAVEFPAQSSARRFPLSGGQVRIGRSSASRDLKPEIDLAGPHADPGISRQHAILIARADDTWAVVDSGSANGTLLNGRKIEVGDEIPLRDGDRINLGAWTVISMHRA